jgi:hypothetical protein
MSFETKSSRPKKQTHYTTGTLFGGREGFEWFERNVSRKIQALPGFSGLTKITDTIARIQAGQFA